MKARKHRGSFDESMSTMKEIPATLDAVAEYFKIPKDSIILEKGWGFDNRIGWESEYWYVETKNGVHGMISEELKFEAPQLIRQQQAEIEALKLRELNDEEIDNIFGICALNPTVTLTTEQCYWVVDAILRKASEK